MQAWLALRLGIEGLQVIKVRRVPPQCTTLSVSLIHTHRHRHTQTHFSLKLQIEWQMQVCNPPSPNPEQSQQRQKKLQAILRLELNTENRITQLN